MCRMHFSKKWLLAVMVCAAILFAFSYHTTARADTAGGMDSISFTEDHSPIMNPERGWYRYFSTDDLGGIEELKGDGISVVYLEANLKDFLDGPISNAKLTEIRNAFAAARKYGLEVMFRAAYDFDGKSDCEPHSLSIITNHIAQLKSIFYANEDILYCVQAGFLGAWGEWHDSYYGDPPSLEAQKAVLFALMDAVPKSRSILVRRPMFIRDIYANAPGGNVLTDSTAFSGSDLSRTGYHDDALLSTSDENGTYVDDAYSTQDELNWVNKQDKYVPFAAESDTLSKYSDPVNALPVLNELHAQVINRDYLPEVIEKWQSTNLDYDGMNFFGYLTERLGYHFVLTGADISATVEKGGALQLKLSLKNDGFGNLCNARGLQIILRNSDGTTTYKADVNDDPRKWYRENGEMTRDWYFSIPSDIASGTWNLYLNLPNTTPSTNKNPASANPAAYSIRLANNGVWDAKTGYNLIKSGIEIASSSPANTITNFEQISASEANLLDQLVLAKVTAPTTITAAAVSYNGIKITWGKAAVATGYELWRSTSSTGDYSLLATSAGTSYTNTAVDTGTVYYYKVRTYCKVGSEKLYSPDSTVVSAHTVLAAPGSPKAVPASYNKINISWGAVAGATNYAVYRYSSSSGVYTLIGTTTTALAFANTAVNTGIVYYYRVYAYRTVAGKKIYSPSSAIVCAKTALSAPTAIKADKASASSIKITWGTVAGATNYEVYSSATLTGKYVLLKMTSSLIYTDTGLSAGTYHYYKVRAYRVVGSVKVYSDFSIVVYAKT